MSRMKFFVPFCIAMTLFGCSHPVPMRVREAALRDCHGPLPTQAAGPSTKGAEPALVLSIDLTLAGESVQHYLPTEQLVNTPVPIAIEPPPTFHFKRIILYYKPFGALHHKPIPMTKGPRGPYAEIPCHEVSVTGPIQYFIVVLGDQGEALGSLGSEEKPFRVKIKNDLEGGAPAAPGMGPPCRCASRED